VGKFLGLLIDGIVSSAHPRAPLNGNAGQQIELLVKTWRLRLISTIPLFSNYTSCLSINPFRRGVTLNRRASLVKDHPSLGGAKIVLR
jgi:hypothetical protein